MRRAVIAVLLLSPLLMGQGPADDGRWRAGAYSYSDELGGFRITGISGTGTADDPVEIVQEFDSASPAMLIIRAEQPIRLLAQPSATRATGMLHLRLVTLNNSGLPWIEFEFELREQREEPSTFGDGLSFDQRSRDSSSIAADSFARYSRDFEPHDRLLFTDGAVDLLRSGVFRMFITDFTPKSVFYLMQDPRAPYS